MSDCEKNEPVRILSGDIEIWTGINLKNLYLVKCF